MEQTLSHKITNIYVFTKAVITRMFSFNIHNKKVLVILDGLIGDTVLVQDFLAECERYFVKQKGYGVDLFFSKSFVKNFYNECCINACFNILPVCYKKAEVDFGDLCRVLNGFKGKRYEIVLNPMPKLRGDKLAACVFAKNKFCVRDDRVVKGKGFNSIFRKIAYTETLDVEKSVMELERYKLLLGMCGDGTYKTKIPQLSLNDAEAFTKPYCVISVGASEIGKRWETNKFAEVINYIHRAYQLNTVFVGANADSELVVEIVQKCGNKNKIIDMTGRTTYSEWVDIIRRASFLLGNDSASAHIAVATNTPSFVIVGEWQYKRFYPYLADDCTEMKQCVINCGMELDCKDCGRVVKQMKNETCKERCCDGRSLECIKMIRVEDVIRKIDDYKYWFM